MIITIVVKTDSNNDNIFAQYNPQYNGLIYFHMSVLFFSLSNWINKWFYQKFNNYNMG